MTRLRCLTVVLFAVPLVSCDTHIQEEGKYAFIAEEVLQDECGTLGSPPQLPAGVLRINGEGVSLDYELFGIQLRGQFREVGESFYLDGSAPNVSTTVGGGACSVDLVQVHIDAASESRSAFTGTLGIRYDDEMLERCRCETSVRFRAELIRSAPP